MIQTHHHHHHLHPFSPNKQTPLETASCPHDDDSAASSESLAQRPVRWQAAVCCRQIESTLRMPWSLLVPTRAVVVVGLVSLCCLCREYNVNVIMNRNEESREAEVVMMGIKRRRMVRRLSSASRGNCVCLIFFARHIRQWAPREFRETKKEKNNDDHVVMDHHSIQSLVLDRTLAA